MNRRASLRGGAVLLILVLGFVAGVYTDQAFPEWVPYFGHRSVSGVDLSELQQAVRLIQADYVDGNLDTKKLSHSSVQGLVSGLGDPFSAYFDPEQYKRLQASYQGRYSGIGIYLSFTTGYPVISGTVPGSPAAAAGLTRVMLPARNRRDFDEIPQGARDKLEFIWLDRVDDAIAEALEESRPAAVAAK